MRATILFVIFINFFLYHAFGTGATTLILLALHVLIFSLFLHKPIVWKMFGIGIVSALAVFVRGNEFVSVLCALFSLLSLTVLMYLAASGGKFFRSFSEILLVPLSLLFPYIQGFLHGIIKLVKSGGRTKSLAMGLFMGVPLAFVLLEHFIQADAIFAYWARSFLNKTMVSRVMTHAVVSGAVFLALLPVSFLVVRSRLNVRALISGFSFARESTVVVGLVVLVVGTFLAVQFPYIFVRVAAETDLSRYGVATYSEYVKQGFGEFLFIACMLYGVSWFGFLWKRRGMVQGILLIEFGIYILSLFRRVWLYSAFHGLTLGRMYGGLFLVWVSLMYLTMVARHIWPKIRWVSVECIGTVVLFFLFAFGNVEHMIATYRPPTVNGRIDYVYLSRLSADGYEGWEKSYIFVYETLTNLSFSKKQVLNEQDRQEIDYARIILDQLTRRYRQYTTQFGPLDRLYVWNWSDQCAYNRMKKDIPISELQQLQQLYIKFSDRIAKQPQSEQGYISDISFDGPFLAPLQ